MQIDFKNIFFNIKKFYLFFQLCWFFVPPLMLAYNCGYTLGICYAVSSGTAFLIILIFNGAPTSGRVSAAVSLFLLTELAHFLTIFFSAVINNGHASSNGSVFLEFGIGTAKFTKIHRGSCTVALDFEAYETIR